MATKILIPTPLRPFTDKKDAVEVEGKTVGELLADLTTGTPASRRICTTPKASCAASSTSTSTTKTSATCRRSRRRSTRATPSASSRRSPAARLRRKRPAALPELTKDDFKRYSRHLILPEVGVQGQQKLKAAKVLCIGAGGLGSPVALYLAAAGVGTIGIVDFDVVDFSNLQRQILHGTPDVGRPKLDSAKDRLLAINPNVNVATYNTALSSENALEIFAPYDIVVDGTDNFPTRYLVNDACVLLGKPNVYGSIFRFEGQASVFATKDGPCYRCLYPEPPPPGLVPSCAEGGVLGVLPGVIGCIQATETIKLILGAGEPLIGRFLIFDALRMKFRELKLRKDPDCPVCGTHPTVTKLIDYEQFCGVQAGRGGASVRRHDRDLGGRSEEAPRPRRRADDRRRARAERVPDQPDQRFDPDSARRHPETLRRARSERRVRDAVQGRRAQREGRRLPAVEGLQEGVEPDGRDPRLDR